MDVITYTCWDYSSTMLITVGPEMDVMNEQSLTSFGVQRYAMHIDI